MKKLWILFSLIVFLLSTSAVHAEDGELYLEFSIRVTKGNQSPVDLYRSGIVTRPDRDFLTHGEFGLIKGDTRAFESFIRVEGFRGPDPDMAVLELKGEYDVFLGNERSGLEVSGELSTEIELEREETRVVSRFVVYDHQLKQSNIIEIVALAIEPDDR